MRDFKLLDIKDTERCLIQIEKMINFLSEKSITSANVREVEITGVNPHNVLRKEIEILMKRILETMPANIGKDMMLSKIREVQEWGHHCIDLKFLEDSEKNASKDKKK